MGKRNIESIRERNMQDNQRFLKQLQMNNIRRDFLKSARSVVKKSEEKNKNNIRYEKVERFTRYSLKVKSGEIQEHVSKWQQSLKQGKGQPSKWTLMYRNNPDPYKRIYKTRFQLISVGGMPNQKRNVEDIRRKNLEDNQLFLKQLLLTNSRDDFVNSARSIVQNSHHTKTPVEYEKVEHITRYSEKVKSGEILPHVPQWKLERERKSMEREQKKQEKEMRRLQRLKQKLPSKWVSYYKNNSNPYERVFKPRHSKIDERIQNESHNK
ncbi:unnamed protein product [Adineta ricciae]|uniref:Uncharacterized protein n=1 Tax=Adineta ricciae TaxID=249248 RepID=A0A813SQN7_ADIRI|nr:unnamed protein product [Adineta ricciae]CAF0808395.1 unnamed protein product [Adineta ricciae]